MTIARSPELRLNKRELKMRVIPSGVFSQRGKQCSPIAFLWLVPACFLPSVVSVFVVLFFVV